MIVWHLYQIGMVLASIAVGVCLASTAWSIHCRRLCTQQYELGREVGRLSERIAANRRTLRLLDAEYRRGWLACEWEDRRLAPIKDVARRVLALQWSRN